MDPNIEQVLLAQAAQEAEQGPRLSDMVALGAGGGAALGALTGAVPHMVGKGIGHMRGTNHFMKPGARMAGGLVGAILGGGLGMGVRQMAIQESPAANMLAKMQAQGTLNPMDRAQLQSVLKDIYNNPGVL